MQDQVRTPVIVAYGRSAIGKAIKGSLAATHPVDFAAQVLRGVLQRVPAVDVGQIDDLIVGCAMPFGKQGINMARLIALKAGLPHAVPAQTVNRFCSSGLQTIASAANAIRAGEAEIIVAGGVEQMNQATMLMEQNDFEPALAARESGAYMTMGLTAENVAARYGITRQAMDAFAVESHRRAALAAEQGHFQDEIIPVEVTDAAGALRVFYTDECIRKGSSPEKLAELNPVFAKDGTVTAGNASQMSDGAAFVVLMSQEKADALGLKPVARFVGFTVAGVDPEVMGIGPIEAVPKLLRRLGLSLSDMDVIEINEAFAAQALACMGQLNMDAAKTNPNGGAIALGHPLGATGAILTCKMIGELARKGGRYGLVTMCIGGGMGAAAVFEKM